MNEQQKELIKMTEFPEGQEGTAAVGFPGSMTRQEAVEYLKEYLECMGAPAMEVTEKSLLCQKIDRQMAPIVMDFLEGHLGRELFQMMFQCGMIETITRNRVEEAGKLLEKIEQPYLKEKLPAAGDSFERIYQIRTEARHMAMEEAIREILTKPVFQD